MFPEIHLWCDTCQPLGSQHGSWSISSTYLQGIGGTQNQELSCHRSQIRQARHSTDWAILARPTFCYHFPGQLPVVTKCVNKISCISYSAKFSYNCSPENLFGLIITICSFLCLQPLPEQWKLSGREQKMHLPRRNYWDFLWEFRWVSHQIFFLLYNSAWK